MKGLVVYTVSYDLCAVDGEGNHVRRRMATTLALPPLT